MAGETIITVVGNLVDDPELRFTPSGAAVANFRIASTPRTFDKQTNEWKDGDALFLSCSVWRQAAENVAESLQKGMRVVVQGRLKQRSYETREGEKRTVVELEVDEVGPSLKYATAKVARVQRSGGGGGYGSSGGNQVVTTRGPPPRHSLRRVPPPASPPSRVAATRAPGAASRAARQLPVASRTTPGQPAALTNRPSDPPHHPPVHPLTIPARAGLREGAPQWPRQ